tara:strand:- start:694 stop:1296 length:603 start_codon:yes stop_codon:yes gene_type:complete
MSAFLTSKKDLSTIAFIWGQFFADSKKESFEKLLSDSFKNIDIKNHTAKLLEFNLEMEDIIFEFLLDTNLESLKARYSDCRDKNRNDLIESWTSEEMQYKNPKLGKISNKEIEEIIGSYTYQSCEHEGFKASTGFYVCKMIIDILNDVLPQELQDKKEGYALTTESTYREDFKVSMSDEEYNEEYKNQSNYDDDAKSVFL